MMQPLVTLAQFWRALRTGSTTLREFASPQTAISMWAERPVRSTGSTTTGGSQSCFEREDSHWD